MNWFHRTCRDLGLLLHNIQHPHESTRVVNQKVEEQKISDTVTLRRTTIEEVRVERRSG